MQFPITRNQLVDAVGTYGFRPDQSARIVADLVGEGRISLDGSMLRIRNPTAPDAQILAGFCRAARGASAGNVSGYKIKEYLNDIHRNAAKHGSSRKA